jgi:hypothetical protein
MSDINALVEEGVGDFLKKNWGKLLIGAWAVNKYHNHLQNKASGIEQKAVTHGVGDLTRGREAQAQRQAEQLQKANQVRNKANLVGMVNPWGAVSNAVSNMKSSYQANQQAKTANEVGQIKQGILNNTYKMPAAKPTVGMV